MAITGSVLGVRSRTTVYRASEPIPVLEVTVNEHETVEQACLRVKKAEQAKLEEAFGKPTVRSSSTN